MHGLLFVLGSADALDASAVLVFHAWISDESYLRVQSLAKFAEDNSVKKEVLGNVMGDYVLRGDFGLSFGFAPRNGSNTILYRVPSGSKCDGR